MRKLLVTLTACLLFAGMLMAQKTITGKVTDEKGVPIPNASVIVKGTTTGTVTKADGTFSLNVPANAKALIVSSVDMRTEEKVIGSLTALDFTMKMEDKVMSEIVVTGTGVATSKKKLGISVETITADKLPQTQSLTQALVGKVAGAQISSTDGTPGARVNILLRGINSLRGGTYPMILLDGLEVRATDLGSLDINSIEKDSIN